LTKQLRSYGYNIDVKIWWKIHALRWKAICVNQQWQHFAWIPHVFLLQHPHGTWDWLLGMSYIIFVSSIWTKQTGLPFHAGRACWALKESILQTDGSSISCSKGMLSTKGKHLAKSNEWDLLFMNFCIIQLRLWISPIPSSISYSLDMTNDPSCKAHFTWIFKSTKEQLYQIIIQVSRLHVHSCYLIPKSQGSSHLLKICQHSF
jgi:hypothetical protein